MHFLNKIIIGIVAVLFCVAIMPTQLVYAAPSMGGISLEPVNDEQGKIRHTFRYVIAEGEEAQDKVVLANYKSETVTIILFASGYSIEDNKIEKVESEPGSLPEPGHWITFDRQFVAVAPKSRVTVGFTVKVPANADVGEHTGAILVTEQMSTSKRKGGTGLSVILQSGSHLAVNVPGDVVRDLVINKISHEVIRAEGRPLQFTFNVTNDGNVTLRSTLDAQVYGLFGKVGEQTGIEISPVIRGETTNVRSIWIKRAPYFGRFVANFKFHLGEHTQYNKDGTTTLLPDEIIEARYVFWIIPGIEILYVLVVVLLLYLLRSLWLYLVISRRLRTKTKVYKAVKHDTLTGIAAKFGVDPRVLAKFNMMRWPYEVKPGDKLLVPIGRMEHEEWREQSRTMLGDREIVGGILGHLFRRRGVHHITKRLMGQDEELGEDVEILIAEKGDTIADVADFADVSLQTVIDMNNLKPPYRLRTGQELIVPKKQPQKKTPSRAGKKTRKKRKGK